MQSMSFLFHPDSFSAEANAFFVARNDVRLGRSARLSVSDASCVDAMRTDDSFLVERMMADAPSVIGEQSRRRSGSATRGLLEIDDAGISLLNCA